MFGSPWAHHQPVARAFLVALVTLAATAIWAQPTDVAPATPTPAISEYLQVTSVNLWVGVDRPKLGFPPKLEPGELELHLAGAPAEIAAVEPVAGELTRRRVVVFIDTLLGDQASVRWSASRLVERGGDLIAIGDVEVVVADPDPRLVLPATSDVERVNAALSSLALFSGTEAAIPLLRDEFLSLSEGDGEGDADTDLELAESFLQEEVALVTQRQDLLLRWLIDAPPAKGSRGSTPDPGGVLLYVSQGFDLDPGVFYLGSRDEEGPVHRETTSWVRTLAAYGWTCAPLVFEDRRALMRRGFRIGKWRFGGSRGKTGGPLVLLSAAYEGERDAEKAAALVELADTRVAVGDYEQAAETYLRAIHHFYGDPRTQSRQAHAWRQLALALQHAGDVDQARRAFANAVELDPTLADKSPLEIAVSMNGVEGLDELASETGGHLLRGGDDLMAAIGELSKRQKVSFSLPGAASGELLPVKLDAKSGSSRLRYARWTRSGAPKRIAGARLRLFLDGADGEPNDAESSTSLELTPLPNGRSLVRLSLPAFDCDRSCRVLIGTLGEESPARVFPLTRESSRSDAERLSGEIEDSDDLIAAAVYTEDLESGEWSTELMAASPR